MTADVKNLMRSRYENSYCEQFLSKEERKLKNREIHDKVIDSLSEKYPERKKKLGRNNS